MIGDVNALDHNHRPLFFDLPFDLGDQQAVAGRDFARFQRAPKGAGQSAAGRGHQVIEGGGVRLVDVGVNVVMFGNFCVNPKENRVLPNRKIGPPERPFYPFDAYV
jgi:hypothetical protein